MNHNHFHTRFQLNERSFNSSKELIDFSLSISQTLHRFFEEWFSEESFINVQTSGSTGVPKKIALKKEQMENSAKATAKFFNAYEDTRALCCLPIDFIAGKMMLVRALTLGWHLDVVEPTSKPLEENNKRYDFSAMVPMQVQNSLTQLSQIKTLIIGGGVVSQSLQNQLSNVSTKCYATYGMTETITHIAVKSLNHDSQEHYKTLSSVKVSKDYRDCLVIQAPMVSDETVVTNDVVELISETEFQWKGRFDNVINSGGVKLHPEVIERKLSAMIDQRFFVAGIPDNLLGEKLILVVEGKVNVTSSSLEKSLKNQKALTKYEFPKEVYFVDQFIETETKKIQRQKTLDLIL